jgi:predicted enzyme related to lactoylglutathione lyase
MSDTFKASRDIIVRTENWSEALKFYGSVLGLPMTEKGETIVGFETGSFCLYVEQGKEHGPVFDFLVPDIEAAKRQLIAAGCTVIEENPKIPRCYIRDPYGMIFNVGQSTEIGLCNLTVGEANGPIAKQPQHVCHDTLDFIQVARLP